LCDCFGCYGIDCSIWVVLVVIVDAQVAG
jgi:hypothetical protein